MGFPRQKYWSGLPFPSAGDLPDPGIEPESPVLQADSLPLSHWEVLVVFLHDDYFHLSTWLSCEVKSLSRYRLFATPWTVAYQLLQPWDFSGKNTGVGCHFLLQAKL